MSAFRDALSRRRQDLNPLATSIPQVPQPYPTPASSVGLSSPFQTQPVYHSVPYTPASAVRQYNPQQWGPSAFSPENAIRYSPGPSEEIEGILKSTLYIDNGLMLFLYSAGTPSIFPTSKRTSNDLWDITR
jgi:hypothetical protein